jgi:hypothetical protein
MRRATFLFLSHFIMLFLFLYHVLPVFFVLLSTFLLLFPLSCFILIFLPRFVFLARVARPLTRYTIIYFTHFHDSRSNSKLGRGKFVLKEQ